LTRTVRSRRAEIANQPLYARALRLRHLAPSGLLCFVFLEGAVVLGILLALAELVSWWGVLVLPMTVALMVKFNDLIAGALTQQQVAVEPTKARASVLREAAMSSAMAEAQTSILPEQSGHRHAGFESGGYDHGAGERQGSAFGPSSFVAPVNQRAAFGPSGLGQSGLGQSGLGQSGFGASDGGRAASFYGVPGGHGPSGFDDGRGFDDGHGSGGFVDGHGFADGHGSHGFMDRHGSHEFADGHGPHGFVDGYSANGHVSGGLGYPGDNSGAAYGEGYSTGPDGGYGPAWPATMPAGNHAQAGDQPGRGAGRPPVGGPVRRQWADQLDVRQQMARQAAARRYE
jgi:hypothetical protein